MKKYFALLALVSSLISAQTIDPSTGNMVYTTSTNGYTNPPPGGDWTGYNWSGFTGTTSNGGGYSGGYTPGWNSTTGTFMFGYNQGTIAYSTPVNYALAQAGTGIQVTGLRYSWEYYNQDYSRGTLTSNISLTSSTGQTLQSYSYNMPYTTNGWTNFSGRETFNTQYTPSSLGNLNVSFTGKDDRWWAGYYGPQVRHIDIGLTYNVAAPPPVPTNFANWIPLAGENDTFTLTKAGVVRYGAENTYIYQSYQPGTYSCSNGAWGNDPIGGVYKYCSLGSNTTTTPSLPKTTTTTTDYATTVPLLDPVTTTTLLDPVTTTTASTSTTSTASDPVATTSVSTSSSPTSAVASVVSAPSPTTSSASITTASSSSSSSSTQSSSKESSGSSGGGNVSLALSVISKNSDRDAAGSAVAQSAVAQAQAAATQAQQEAQSVASNAVSNSVSANIVSVGGQQSNSTSSGNRLANSSNSTNFSLQSGVTSVANVTAGPQSSQSTILVQQQNSSTTAINVSNNQSVIVSNVPAQQTEATNNVTQFVLPLLSPVTQSASLPTIVVPVVAVEQPQQTPQVTTQNTTNTSQPIEVAMVNPNMLTDKSNPLTDIVEGKQNIPQSTTTTMTGPAVNKNAQDNEVAGGVDINKMALAPAGYNSYLNLALRDAAFYAPKEVYKNQVNVDNARALRLLTNDSKHKEMVEMQYAK